MQYVWGALAGLVWGALAAFVNYRINKAAVKKNSNASMLTANAARMGVDLITLGAVYLLRKQLPFSFEATIIAAAIALSMLSIVFAYRLIKPEKK
ncbi:MAG: hypothetical protein Q4E38_01170 [Eubacteriales bacterium]|nr:hypothetical protein [Eubacteriales bacterium]